MALLFTMIFISLLRIVSVALNQNLNAAAQKQGSYKLKVSQQRGTIFDANMLPLTNNETEIIAAVAPAFGVMDEIRDYLYDESPASLAHRLADGKPVLVRLRQEVNTKNVKSTRVYKNSGGMATHLIGYTDGEGHGVCGVEAAFDEWLYCEDSVEFIFSMSAAGEILEGGAGLQENADAEQNGVQLTIDSKIQRAVEAAVEMKSGAIVVGEVGTGKIRALASFPDYDVKNLKDYLDDAAAPLINRAFCAYNVGSVFKPCVAAAAIEDGVYKNMIYSCEGYREIAGKNFACHNREGHGVMNIKSAIRESCNTYFYALGMALGAEKLYDMASALGFGTRYTFGGNLKTEQCRLPTASELSASEQSIANLSIGQGSLMLTPISLLPLYEAIANGGVYHRPTLIEGRVLDGKLEKQTNENYPTRVMSEKTAKLLGEALLEVLEVGTGKNAAPKLCTAAGKTATAQTGWLREGKAVDHSWLCGYFPAENPKYTVVIISENTSGGGTPCAPLFSAVCDAIYTLNLS